LKIFFDSSVLVPVFLAEHPHHAPSIKLFQNSTPEIACCASHSLAEVYATLTRLPLPHRAKPFQALECLEAIQKRCTLVSLSGELYLAAVRDAAAKQIVDGNVYDALLARCALQMDVEEIYTWNDRHFHLLGEEVSKRVKTPATR
jgi:predicted nucleic acid-binding protein